MKKTIKIIILVSLLLIPVTNFSLASTAGSIISDADKWLNKGSNNSPITTQTAWDKLSPIASILMAIATGVLVVMYMWLGIKYMMTDPNGKADIKQKLIGLVIATVVVYGGMGLFTIIVNLLNSIL